MKAPVPRPVDDLDTTSDAALLAWLLGLSVRCPYGPVVAECPFLPMQQQPLRRALASLAALPREERIALLRAHRTCLRERETQ